MGKILCNIIPFLVSEKCRKLLSGQLFDTYKYGIIFDRLPCSSLLPLNQSPFHHITMQMLVLLDPAIHVKL